MAGHRSLRHHLDALQDVLDAASSDAHGLALPWEVLAHLRSLLRSDLVAFEGLDHERGRSYFVQVSTPDLEEYADGTDPGATARVRRVVQRALSSAAESVSGTAGCTTSRLLVGIPDGRGRELRLLTVRRTGRTYDACDRIDLRLLLPHLEAVYRRGAEQRACEAVTQRQAVLMELVRDGYTNTQIAHRLELAEGTVRTHLNNIYARLSVQSRTEAVSRLYGARGPAVVTDDLSPP
jgi:DNA-binding CsgD family transcriptional regulator